MLPLPSFEAPQNFKTNFDFSNPNFFKASDEEDINYGIDFWLCGIPIAYRKRRRTFPGDVSIRYRINTGSRTEYIKILEGDFKAKLFIYEFTDKVIFVDVRSIFEALKLHRFKIIPNFDKKTEGAYIELTHLNYLEWNKQYA